MNAILKAFANRRMAVILLLGFSSGMPLGLTGAALQGWLTDAGIDLKTIAVLSLVGLPYTFKFAWSPLMDRFVPPVFGRRRGWMLVAQAALVAGILAMAFTNPAADPYLMAFFALCVAFFSASQDIVVDAYRTEILHREELGAGSSLAIMGYRVGMLASTALALILAQVLPWSTVYLIMAGSMVVGIGAAIFAPEPRLDVSPPVSLYDAVVHPFREFLRRRGAVEVLVFILIFKLDVALTLALQVPFMRHLGFTNADIGLFTNSFGLVATIVGSLIGGAAMVRLGIYRGLWTFGLLQGLSGLSYALLAWLGHSYPMMIAAVIVENVCAGMGTVAYTAFLMSICDRRFTATQYALLTSLMAVARYLAIPPAGVLVEAIGWPVFFLIATLVAVPGLLLLLRYRYWTAPEMRATE